MNVTVQEITTDYPYDLLLFADESECSVSVELMRIPPIVVSSNCVFMKRTGLFNTI